MRSLVGVRKLQPCSRVRPLADVNVSLEDIGVVLFARFRTPLSRLQPASRKSRKPRL